MNRLWEILLGLSPGFLSRDGTLAFDFNPRWPLQDSVGVGTWNFFLGLIAIVIVVYVYRRDGGRAKTGRVALASFRLALAALVIFLLNRPVLTLGTTRTEPSVLAILIDRSISMGIPDGATGSDASPSTRLQDVLRLLDRKIAATPAGPARQEQVQQRRLIEDLSTKHVIRIFRFDNDAVAVTTLPRNSTMAASLVPSTQPLTPATGPATVPTDPGSAIAAIEPQGESTQVVRSIRQVMQDLQGQRVAGIVVLTDGRETPTASQSEEIESLKAFAMKVFPVVVGSDREPRNVEIVAASVEDAVFAGDITQVRVTAAASGYAEGQEVTLRLRSMSGKPLLDIEGKPVERKVRTTPGKPIIEDLQFKPDAEGDMAFQIVVDPLPGEITGGDNVVDAQITVVKGPINVLYIEGYPRWEFRYIRNSLIRDESVNLSTILTSADPGFIQDGDRPAGFKFFPFREFPNNAEQLSEVDVILLGDVDPRQFTDVQRQLISDFVFKQNGGFGVIAGPRYAPAKWRGTEIEPLLPVRIAGVDQSVQANIPAGFKLKLTEAGWNSTLFRFRSSREENRAYIEKDIQNVFWYLRGITASPTAQVLAEHPKENGPDGRPAPLVVQGRFGGGRTFFSAFDETWRYRYYTNESTFDTFWVQSVRYLARGRKLGQRKLNLISARPEYFVGQVVSLTSRSLDPKVLTQVPDPLLVEIYDAADESPSRQPLRREILARQPDDAERFIASFVADRPGRYLARIAPFGDVSNEVTARFIVRLPRLELASPQVNRALLTELATATGASVADAENPQNQSPWQIAYASAPSLLPRIASAEQVTPVITTESLWDAPISLLLFTLLIAGEWIGRKLKGLL